MAGTSPAMTDESSWQLEQRLRVAEADLLLVRLRNVERRDDLHGLADVARPALGAERRVGSEQHMIGAVEFEPALGADAPAAERGVGVEILEAVEQRLAEE